jgi:hypothetical protein
MRCKVRIFDLLDSKSGFLNWSFDGVLVLVGELWLLFNENILGRGTKV